MSNCRKAIMKCGIFNLMENWNDDEERTLLESLELIQYCDELGFDEMWIGEHHFNSFSICSSAMTLISCALAKTKKIKIGSAALLLPYYHPIELAEEIATLDLISQGRFLFGFARGVFSYFDISKNNPISNREIMMESAEVIHNLLFKEQIHFKGEYFSLEDISLRPHPRGCIPFYIASDDEVTLQRAASLGYHFLGSLTLKESRACEIHKIFSQKRREYEFVLTRAFYADEDRNVAKEKAQIAVDIFTQCMLKGSNLVFEKIADTGDEEFRAEFFNKEKILESMIVGNPKDCIEQIRTLQMRVPFTSLALKLLGSNLEDFKRNVKTFKEEIFPFI
ncbi:LLM class flavin-dependent oxidoreductase [Helicobacter mesocricetorum]|uniref:LLM class flavin-dependent oxidoreductase n=1 Tax=Helicobacter mesocricetorum TaxID=87012 RepID=UPI001F3739E0|nr:LLM class flavin-dependent oxidoreductase [Helicobacter mesocricetorum]